MGHGRKDDDLCGLTDDQHEAEADRAAVAALQPELVAMTREAIDRSLENVAALDKRVFDLVATARKASSLRDAAELHEANDSKLTRSRDMAAPRRRQP
jgi:hypothetical protein